MKLVSIYLKFYDSCAANFFMFKYLTININFNKNSFLTDNIATTAVLV